MNIKINLHHHNIFVYKNNYNKIVAIIDFGDLNKTCTVFELSYCCCHFMLNKSKNKGIDIMLDIIYLCMFTCFNSMYVSSKRCCISSREFLSQ